MTTTTGPSEVGTTAAPQPPIGPYQRVPVQVHQADPQAPEVARHLIALIASRWPATPAEHVGSTAVPGLAGKGIIDLLLAAAWPTTRRAGSTRTTWTWTTRTSWPQDPSIPHWS